MLLIDSSAWIEYLRRDDTSASEAVRAAIRDQQAAVTDVVLLEVLGGTTSSARLERWQRLMAGCAYLEQRPREDVETAADLYRRCRSRGKTPRALNNCLLAAVAIRVNLPVLHRDRDFDVLARHTPLQVVAA
ncbi:type II toxin-antitoxin system VapC family toxin [Jatrophihabitans endophyticus]|uniref:type II toxin-antitoxin system VapC family toxin n=1 Tax=Jatrophihabitans endophyticus TaxID=1206085 RepID=UPI000934AF15|nr:PIN domain nuclease [Jatrophihabitans endophyticus]